MGSAPFLILYIVVTEVYRQVKMRIIICNKLLQQQTDYALVFICEFM